MSARRSSKHPPPRVDLIAELVGGMVGRAVYAARDYREVVAEGAGETIDVCAGCEVDCCASFTVPLNVVDAMRLRRGLDLPWTTFVALAACPPDMPTFPVRLGQGRAMLSLKRRRGACPFRLRLGRHRRCGVHALRPTACRLFPFLPDLDAQRRAPQGMLAQRPPRDCPWRWPASDQARAELELKLKEDARLRRIDGEVLRRWHRQTEQLHTARNFFHFLELELQRVASEGELAER